MSRPPLPRVATRFHGLAVRLLLLPVVAIISGLWTPPAAAETETLTPIVIDSTSTISVDPAVLQANAASRPLEPIVPATPDYTLIGVGTESPALLVQKNALGRGWHELQIETQVLNALLELHGLAPDQRSRMLRWERDEVRAGCHRRLLEILNKTSRSSAEQQVYDSMTAAIKAAHIAATEESQRLYNRWFFAPELFQPPPPFPYDPPPPSNHGLFYLFGGPKPPSFEEFQQYGVAVAFADAGGDGALQRIMASTARRSAIVGSAVLTSGVVGAAAGVALAAALPTIITEIVVKVVIPFAARAASQGVASAAGVLGGSVVGAVVFVVVTAVFEGIAVVDASQVPGKLQEAVNKARAMTVNLPDYLTTDAGMGQIYSVFLKTTLPDFPATEQAPVAVATDQQWITAPVGSPWYRTAPTLQMKDLTGAPISVRLMDGWFVIRDQTGRETLTVNLEYQGTEGQPQTVTKLAGGFFCTDATGNLTGCAKVSEFSFRNWSNQPRTARLGSGGAQAVITPADLPDASVGVAYSQPLSVTSPGAGTYTFSVVTDGPGLPPGMTLAETGLLGGTPSAAGTYVFEIHATNPGGSHPVVQSFTLRINGVPAPSPANLLNSWLFEGNASDAVGTAHGTWSGTAAYSANGRVGKAASFNGSSSIELPQNIFPVVPMTFETWFRTSGAGVILGQVGVNTGYVPAIYVDTNGKLRVSFFWGGGSAPTPTVASVNNGQWHHVAVTHDGATQRVYLDGALVETKNFTQAGYASGYRYFLGYGSAAGWPAVNNGYFTGEIDEAAIYSRALGAAEIQAIHAAAGAGKVALTLGNLATSGTVGVYQSETLSVLRNGTPAPPLDDLRVVSGALPHGLSLSTANNSLSGTPRTVGTFPFVVRATDVSGHSGEKSYTITVTGPWRPRPDGLMSWWPGEGSLADRIPPIQNLGWKDPLTALTYGAGVVGQAFTNLSYGLLPNLPNFGIAGFTWEMWIQTTGEAVIVGRTVGGNPYPVVWVGRDGLVRMDLSLPTDPANARPIVSPTRVNDGGWHHVAVSYGSGEQRLHVDGLLAGMGRGLTNVSAVFGSTYTLGGMEPLYFPWPGLPQGSLNNPYLSVARIDEPSVYGRVLETVEIAGVFASGSRGKPTLIVAERTLPPVTRGIPYRQTLTAEGATAPLTWTIAGGQLPEGLQLSTGGVISGMLTRIRSTAVSIQVTDNTGAVGVRDYIMNAAGPPATLPPGAMAWWRGELNTRDSLGSRHAVPLNSGPTYRTGTGGSAFYFNRAGSSLSLPAGSFPAIDTLVGSHNPYSFETWFMTDRPGAILGRRDFAHPALPVVYKPGLYVGTDGRLRAPMYEVDRTASPPVSSQRVDDGRFHHAAVTFDGSTLRLYVDGVLQSPVITGATSRYGSLVDTVELGTAFTGTLGLTWPGTTGGWMHFSGVIDEPTTYGRVLSPAEIGAINGAGEAGKAFAPAVSFTLPNGRVDGAYLADAYTGPEATLVFGGGEIPPGLGVSRDGIVSGIPRSAGPFQFQCGIQRSDGSWLDGRYSLMVEGTPASPVGATAWYSGDGNTNGHAVGDTVVSPNGIGYAVGEVGQAFSFDGTSQYLAVNSVPFPAPGGDWSFETWFRTAVPAGVILGQNDGGASYVPLLYVGSDGLLRSSPYWAGTSSTLASQTRVDDGIFHHAVFTYSNGLRKLYLDGVLVDSATAPGVGYAATYYHRLGHGTVVNWPSAPANPFFTGQIDEPQFYNRALRPAEARRGYSSGKFGRSAIVLDNPLVDATAFTSAYSRQIAATGGTGPYTFALTEGRLPGGLTLSPQGLISGSITYASGLFEFAVEATSSTGAKSVRDYQIVVQPNARFRPAGLTAWWAANGSADDWTGSHPASAFSNVGGQPFSFSEGTNGQAFNFRGLGMGQTFGIPFIKEAVNLPKSAFPLLGERGPFSLELWFRATKAGGILGQSFQAVLGDYSLPMIYIDTAGYLRTQIGWSATQNQIVSPAIVLDNTWHHFVGTLDAAGVMQVYLDGTLIDTRTGIGPVRENPQAEFYLGHVLAPTWPASGDSGLGVTFTGQIDEVSTWSRILSQDDVRRLASCGTNGKAVRTITPNGGLPPLARNVPWTQPLTVTAQASPFFSLLSGSLPPGISLTTSTSVSPPVNGLYGTPTTVGSWDFSVRNTSSSGALATTEIVDEEFSLTVDLSSAYSQWADAAGGLDRSARLPLESPFADSSNLLKYAFNLNPAGNDTRRLTPGSGTAGAPFIGRDASGHLVIEFLRRRSATNPGIIYQVETGTDFTGYAPLSLAGASVTPIDAAFERVTVTDPTVTPRRFGRVRILTEP